MTEWKTVIGWPHYEVSSDAGRLMPICNCECHQWRDIETAPTDHEAYSGGLRILTLDRGGIYLTVRSFNGMKQGGWFDAETHWQLHPGWFDAETHWQLHPTHWMPLPPPPASPSQA